jgi:hypothetical protein
MVALYKQKGDIKDLDNWRGICLLPVLSKACAVLVNDCLRKAIELTVHEAQLGFRRFRGTSDGIFLCRRVLEEVRLTAPADADHLDRGVFALFVDLKKAFDSAPQAVIWEILPALGAPVGYVKLLEAIHVGMGACVKWQGRLSRRFLMQTGVRQGAIEAPSLWDLYFDAVLRDWRGRLEARLGRRPGLVFKCNPDGNLARTHGRILKTDKVECAIADIEYADDLAAFFSSFEDLTIGLDLLDQCIADWGGELSIHKTKWLQVKGVESPPGPDPALRLLLRGQEVEQVPHFTYLGSVVGSDFDLGQGKDVNTRIRAACATFGRLRGLWRDPRVKLPTKRKVFLACVKSTLLYGSETWTLRHSSSKALRRAWAGWIRTILGLTWQQCVQDHISHSELNHRFGVEDVVTYAARSSLRWLGHVGRMVPSRWPHLLLFGALDGRGPAVIRGARKGLCKSTIEQGRNILRDAGIDERIWAHEARDRPKWREYVATYHPERRHGLAPQQRTGGSLTCPLCGKTARNPNGLTAHIQDIHPLHPLPQLACSICQRPYANKGVLLRHMRKAHPEAEAAANHEGEVPAAPPAPAPPGPPAPPAQPRPHRHFCSCGRGFPFPGRLATHRQTMGCP